MKRLSIASNMQPLRMQPLRVRPLQRIAPVTGMLPFLLVLALVSAMPVRAQVQASSAPMLARTYEADIPAKNLAWLNRAVDLRLDEAPLGRALQAVAREGGLHLSYSHDVLALDKRITLDVQQATVLEVLHEIIRDTPLRLQISASGHLIVRRKDGDPDGDAASDEELASEPAPAPPHTVRGTVYDADQGEPLPAVNVVVKGTTVGTITGTEGEYELQAPSANDTLVFSFIGFIEQEIPIAGRSVIDVELAPDVEELDEVVVVGYGSMRKRDLTGAVTSVDAEEINDIPATTIEQALQGRAPGMVITSSSGEPGAGLSISIRGANSISGNNEPLFVIDGHPMYNDNESLASEASINEGNVSTNYLANLNPNDIESVQVLKDASATAIYGSRGANGVIVITTKQGSTGDARVTFEHYTSATRVPETIGLADAYEYALLDNMGARAAGVDVRYSGSWETNENGDSLYHPSPQEVREIHGPGTDWQEAILRTGITQNYQLGISGGSETLRYNISGNYFDDKGVLQYSAFQRYSLRANLFTQISERLSFRLNATGSRTLADRVQTSSSELVGSSYDRSGLIWKTFRANPLGDPYALDLDDPLAGTQGTIGFNPLVELENTHDMATTNVVLANATVEFELLDGLTFTSRNGAHLTQNAKEFFYNQNTLRGNRFNDQAIESTANRLDVLTENYFNYKKLLGEAHSLDFTLGMSYQDIENLRQRLEVENYTLNFDNGLYLYGFADNHSRHNSSLVEQALLSYYGRGMYSLLDRYLFTFTGRADGSSKFAANKKWAFFPSGAFAWRFTEEPFLRDQDVLSNGKLRLSYGLTGSQAIGPYGSLPIMGLSIWELASGALATGVGASTPGNTDLTWETTEQVNAGLDLGFRDDRYNLIVDVYHKTTRDLLQWKSVPAQSGFTTMISNFGSIRNTGLELSLSADVFSSGDFTWTSSANYSTNRSEVLDLGERDYILGGAFGQRNKEPTHIIQVGEPLGNFYGYQVVGLLSEEDLAEGYPTLSVFDKPGMFKIWNNPADSAGLNVISGNDRVILGNALPDFVFGWSNDLSYKRVSLSFFIQGVIGQEVLNMTRMLTEYGDTQMGNPSEAYLADYWTEDNRDAYYPRPAYLSNGGQYTTSRLVEDGSFVRLRNVSLAYNLPRDLVSGMRSAQVYVTGTNLLALTGYTGYDPEVNSYGQTIIAPGVDMGAYPRPRMFTIGVKLGF